MDLLFPQMFACCDILCPDFKEFGGAYCVYSVRYFVSVFLQGLEHCYGQRYTEFNINMSIFMYYLSPHTKQYESSISEVVFSSLNHTCTILEIC